MNNKNNLIGGMTDLIVLHFLEQKDCYVYEMTKAVEELSEGFLNISQNTIYTATYKMETEKMISEYSVLVGRKRTRVYYRIEQKGRDYLAELRQQYHSTFSGMENILKKQIGVIADEESFND
ncbi:MAG: PadR family transcriptional regulator [Lachnospiraceae bacterium]|nr:PadR family transcriptional regulator [Lachnospiraceae bacterium]